MNLPTSPSDFTESQKSTTAFPRRPPSERRAKIRLFCLCIILSAVGMFNVAMSQSYLANAHQMMYEMMRDQISFTIVARGENNDTNRKTIGEAEMKVWWSAMIALQHAGAFFGGYLFVVWDRQLGRLWTVVVVTSVFGIAGNVCKLMIVFPHCWPMFFLGRVFSGIVEGVTVCGVPVFICEIAPKSMRTLLGMMLPFGCAINSVIVMFLGRENVLGGSTTWPYAYGLNTISCTLVLPVALFLPRSPAYLLSCNRERAARASLQFYHGSETELDAARRDASVLEKARKGAPFKFLAEKTLKKQIRLSIAIAAGFIIYDLVAPFSTLMFMDAGFSLQAGSNLSTGIKVQAVLDFLITLPMAGRIRHRAKFLFGTSLVAITTVMLGVTNGLHSLLGIPTSITSPLFAAFLFVNQAAQDIGIRALFYVLIPEMYPYQYRAAGKSFSFIAFRLISFVMSFAFAPALFYSNLWAYIGFSVPLWLGFGYCFRHLRETSNQHLWEIYEKLRAEDEESRPLLAGKA